MPNLVESLMGAVGPQVIRSLSSRLGESESAIQNGLQSSSATILGSLASKAGDSNFLGRVFNMITASGSTDILGNLSSLASGDDSSPISELGKKFLSQVLGPQQTAATDAIASASGLRASSASSLLSMAGPMVMGLLAKRVTEGNLNPASFARMLTSELPALKSLMPAGSVH